ncbi:unnamed protein product [Owenia fusiformis]|nr:unnamed protein product [Owenia fusiformis]
MERYRESPPPGGPHVIKTGPRNPLRDSGYFDESLHVYNSSDDNLDDDLWNGSDRDADDERNSPIRRAQSMESMSVRLDSGYQTPQSLPSPTGPNDESPKKRSRSTSYLNRSNGPNASFRNDSSVPTRSHSMGHLDFTPYVSDVITIDSDVPNTYKTFTTHLCHFSHLDVNTGKLLDIDVDNDNASMNVSTDEIHPEDTVYGTKMISFPQTVQHASYAKPKSKTEHSVEVGPMRHHSYVVHLFLNKRKTIELGPEEDWEIETSQQTTTQRRVTEVVEEEIMTQQPPEIETNETTTQTNIQQVVTNVQIKPDIQRESHVTYLHMNKKRLVELEVEPVIKEQLIQQTVEETVHQEQVKPVVDAGVQISCFAHVYGNTACQTDDDAPYVEAESSQTEKPSMIDRLVNTDPDLFEEFVSKWYKSTEEVTTTVQKPGAVANGTQTNQKPLTNTNVNTDDSMFSEYIFDVFQSSLPVTENADIQTVDTTKPPRMVDQGVNVTNESNNAQCQTLNKSTTNTDMSTDNNMFEEYIKQNFVAAAVSKMTIASAQKELALRERLRELEMRTETVVDGPSVSSIECQTDPLVDMEENEIITTTETTTTVSKEEQEADVRAQALELFEQYKEEYRLSMLRPMSDAEAQCDEEIEDEEWRHEEWTDTHTHSFSDRQTTEKELLQSALDNSHVDTLLQNLMEKVVTTQTLVEGGETVVVRDAETQTKIDLATFDYSDFPIRSQIIRVKVPLVDHFGRPQTLYVNEPYRPYESLKNYKYQFGHH